jgi:F0F1-type ATP synthase assembly protein I
MDEKDASCMAEAMRWVSRCTSISLMFCLPALGGMWLDSKVGTMPLFVIMGVFLGFGMGMWSLIQLGKENGTDKPDT